MNLWTPLLLSLFGGLVGGVTGAWLTAKSRARSVELLAAKMDAWGSELRGHSQRLHHRLGDQESLDPAVVAALNTLSLRKHPHRRAEDSDQIQVVGSEEA